MIIESTIKTLSTDNFSSKKEFNKMNSSFKPLLSIGISYIVDVCPQIAPNVLQYLQTILDGFIDGKISQYNASLEFSKYIGNNTPILKIARVLTVSPQPLKSINEYPA